MGKTRETEPMIRRAFVLLLCSITLMILAGCAAPPPETEEPAAAVPGEGAVPAEGNTGGITEGDLAQQGPGVTGQGSLEALKEGTTPQTGVLADVYFEFDRSELAAEAREVLQRNSDWIKENPGVQIEIEGHADNRGYQRVQSCSRLEKSAGGQRLPGDPGGRAGALFDHQLRRGTSGLRRELGGMLADEPTCAFRRSGAKAFFLITQFMSRVANDARAFATPGTGTFRAPCPARE